MSSEVRLDDYILLYNQSNEEHRRVQTSERKTYTSKLRKAKTEAGHKATAHTITQNAPRIDKETGERHRVCVYFFVLIRISHIFTLCELRSAAHQRALVDEVVGKGESG